MKMRLTDYARIRVWLLFGTQKGAQWRHVASTQTQRNVKSPFASPPHVSFILLNIVIDHSGASLAFAHYLPVHSPSHDNQICSSGKHTVICNSFPCPPDI